MSETVVPYGEDKGSKREQVEQMFDNISGKYDFLNHFLSLGIDIRWRKKALKMVDNPNPKRLLDVATGTGDFGLEALKKWQDLKVSGIDISNGMLDVGRKKIKDRNIDRMEMIQADSADIPFKDEEFNLVIVAFGVRNYAELEKGLREMHRVLKKGGEVIILEFSKPRSFPFKQLYNFYFKYILPFFGKLISKDNRAYTYLPESVQAFPEGEAFVKILSQCGYTKARAISLTLGIASIYHAKK